MAAGDGQRPWQTFSCRRLGFLFCVPGEVLLQRTHALRWGPSSAQRALPPRGLVLTEGEPRSGGTLQGRPGVSRWGFCVKDLKRVKERARVKLVDNSFFPFKIKYLFYVSVSDITIWRCLI